MVNDLKAFSERGSKHVAHRVAQSTGIDQSAHMVMSGRSASLNDTFGQVDCIRGGATPHRNNQIRFSALFERNNSSSRSYPRPGLDRRGSAQSAIAFGSEKVVSGRTKRCKDRICYMLGEKVTALAPGAKSDLSSCATCSIQGR